VEKAFLYRWKSFEISFFPGLFGLPPPPGHSMHQSVEIWLKLEVFYCLKNLLKTTFFNVL